MENLSSTIIDKHGAVLRVSRIAGDLQVRTYSGEAFSEHPFVVVSPGGGGGRLGNACVALSTLRRLMLLDHDAMEHMSGEKGMRLNNHSGEPGESGPEYSHSGEGMDEAKNYVRSLESKKESVVTFPADNAMDSVLQLRAENGNWIIAVQDVKQRAVNSHGAEVCVEPETYPNTFRGLTQLHKALLLDLPVVMAQANALSDRRRGWSK